MLWGELKTIRPRYSGWGPWLGLSLYSISWPPGGVWVRSPVTSTTVRRSGSVFVSRNQFLDINGKSWMFFRIMGSQFTRNGQHPPSLLGQLVKLLIVNWLFHALAIFCFPHEINVCKCLLKLELEMFPDWSDLDIRASVSLLGRSGRVCAESWQLQTSLICDWSGQPWQKCRLSLSFLFLFNREDFLSTWTRSDRVVSFVSNHQTFSYH